MPNSIESTESSVLGEELNSRIGPIDLEASTTSRGFSWLPTTSIRTGRLIRPSLMV